MEFSATYHGGNHEGFQRVRGAAVFGGVYVESAVVKGFCSFFALFQVVWS